MRFIDTAGVVVLEGAYDVVRGPFTFHYDTPGLENGLPFFTPTIGDILLDAWFEVDVAFNGGSGALADIGTAVGSAFGLWFGSNYGIFDITSADGDGARNGGGTFNTGLLQNLNGNISSLAGLNAVNAVRVVPGKFLTADPWKVWVSTNGQAGGGPVGGSAGTASVYIVTATPVPFTS